MEEMERAIDKVNRMNPLKGLPVKLVRQGKSLYCRGVFPVRDGDGCKQQRIPLGLKAELLNVSTGVRECQRLGGLLLPLFVCLAGSGTG
jgi:hypothetical protein